MEKSIKVGSGKTKKIVPLQAPEPMALIAGLFQKDCPRS